MCDMAMDLWHTKSNNNNTIESQLHGERFLKQAKARMRNLFYAQNNVFLFNYNYIAFLQDKQSLPYLNLLSTHSQ